VATTRVCLPDKGEGDLAVRDGGGWDGKCMDGKTLSR